MDTIVATYAANNKRSGPGLADAAGGGALAIEHGLYVLKWAIPLLLLVASGWLARGAVTPQPMDRGFSAAHGTLSRADHDRIVHGLWMRPIVAAHS